MSDNKTWEYWKKQAKKSAEHSTQTTVADRLLYWENAYNQLENAYYALKQEARAQVLKEDEELKKDACCSRERYTEKFPTTIDLLSDWEALHGLLIQCASIGFKDDRQVFVFQFEKVFLLNFHNAENEPPHNLQQVILSYEAAAALDVLTSVMLTRQNFEHMISMLNKNIE